VTTLPNARRALARKPGLGLSIVHTGWESAGVYTGTPNLSDARRTIVTSDLVRMTVSGSSDTEARSDFHDAEWVYRPTDGVQRQLANQGYVGDVEAESVTDLALNTDSVAVLRVVRNFAAALAPNTLLELHTMPVVDADMQTGLHTFLNRAGRAMWFRKRLSFTADGTRRASLAAYPWLFDESQLIGVFDREITTGTDPLPLTGGGELRFDGQVPYLLLGPAVPSGQAFYADVWRPRSSWIKVSGTWADSTLGLVNETDEMYVDLDQLVTVAYYFLCDDRAQNHPRGEESSWAKLRDRAASEAAPFMAWQRPAIVQANQRDESRLRYGRRMNGRSLGLRGWP
jgi:hypothetical protein